MKIFTETAAQGSAVNEPWQVREPVSAVKFFAGLNPGDSFKALVLDIKPGFVTIRLANGESMTARSLVLPDARIGEETVFTVKESAKGQILLEMQKPGFDITQSHIAKEALLNAKLYPSAENVDITKTLMNNRLPIDADSLQKTLFFKYSGSGLNMDEVLFLLKENFPMQDVSAGMLNAVLDKDNRLDAQLTRLVDYLEAQQEPERKEAVIKHLAELLPENERKQTNKAILRRLFLNPREDGIKELGRYYKTLHKAVSEALEEVTGRDAIASKQLGDIKNSIEFMDHINNYKQYMQIPFMTDNGAKTGELFVFKDPKEKKSDGCGQISALIGLDLNSLGRVEAFIMAHEKRLNFQFRSDKAETVKLINRHFDTLSKMLALKGYTVTAAAFKKIDESFTVVQDIVGWDSSGQGSASGNARYSFDMRV